MICTRMRTCNDSLRKSRKEFFLGATSDVINVRFFLVDEGKSVCSRYGCFLKGFLTPHFDFFHFIHGSTTVCSIKSFRLLRVLLVRENLPKVLIKTTTAVNMCRAPLFTFGVSQVLRIDQLSRNLNLKSGSAMHASIKGSYLPLLKRSTNKPEQRVQGYANGLWH